MRQVLSPPLMQIFLCMQPGEQTHCLRVFKKLIGQGETSHDLLNAALLHDVGKSRYPLRQWERVLIVICQAFIPEQAKQLGEGKAQGWRRPFVVAQKHPEWGAEMAETAGASPLTISLIREHQEPFQKSEDEKEKLLKRLILADHES